MTSLTNPVGVFDAGIGSFGIVESIRKTNANQDIIWLADRASFPLGQKSADELFQVGCNCIKLLSDLGCQTIVVAANVLSMIVFDRLQNEFPDLYLHGITPPVKKASSYGNFCVLGVKAMVDDPKLRQFIENEKLAGTNGYVANGSPLIDELVETGLFNSDPDYTQSVVSRFVTDLPEECRKASAYTLSSTHLPWLKPVFEKVHSEKIFLDPADDLMKQMNLYHDGSGKVLALTTENLGRDLTADGLTNILNFMGYDLTPQIVSNPEY